MEDETLRQILQALAASGGLPLVGGALGQILRSLHASETAHVARAQEVDALHAAIASLEERIRTLEAERADSSDATVLVNSIIDELQWHQ